MEIFIYVMMLKGELITRLKVDYFALLKSIEGLSEKQMRKKWLGKWGVREILAHLAAWDLENIRITKAIMSGKIPDFFKEARGYAGLGKRCNEMNHEFINVRKGWSITKIKNELEENKRKLINYVKKNCPPNLSKDFGVRWGKTPITIAFYFDYPHDAIHIEQILRWRKGSKIMTIKMNETIKKSGVTKVNEMIEMIIMIGVFMLLQCVAFLAHLT